MTIHVAMNIAAKDAIYAGARRAPKIGRIFAIYDVVKGEGGALSRALGTRSGNQAPRDPGSDAPTPERC